MTGSNHDLSLAKILSPLAASLDLSTRKVSSLSQTQLEHLSGRQFVILALLNHLRLGAVTRSAFKPFTLPSILSPIALRAMATVTNPAGYDPSLSIAENLAKIEPKHEKLHGRAFYENIDSPKFVLAPMVDASEFVWPPSCSTLAVTLRQPVAYRLG